MDSTEVEITQQAVLGLAVLAAIPVVLFALWADYFGRYVLSARKSTPGFDPKLERERIHVAAASVFLFQFILFLGSLDVVQAFPKSCGSILLGCVVVIGYIQGRIEGQLIPKQLSAQAINATKTVTSFRALVFGLLSGFLYVSTLLVFVKVATWIATTFAFTPFWGASFVMAAAAAGIFAGLSMNFALAPWQMKKTLPITALTEEEKALLEVPMLKAGLKNFEFWIIEDRQATAAIAGYRRGSGVFNPVLFISRSVMTTLSKEELTAVVAHEAAHVMANHLKKRILLSGALIAGLTFSALFCTLASFTLIPGASSEIGMFFGAAAFGLAFFVLQKQNRVHEFQADWLAVRNLGADFESWASALRKMDQLNGHKILPGVLSSHPDTETRIQNVAKMIEFFSIMKNEEKKNSTPAQNSDSSDSNDDQGRAA